jgi:hypothetical protein
VTELSFVLGRDITGEPYGGIALAELKAGEELKTSAVGNPAVYAHTMIDLYVLATGDFLRGSAETTKSTHNLAFSSAATARSATEYASIGWWLADPGLTAEQRIARSAGVTFESIKNGLKSRNAEQRTEYSEEMKPLLGWIEKSSLGKKHYLPDETKRLQQMSREYGDKDYHNYSLVAHGDLALTAKLIKEKKQEGAEDIREPLWRLLAASEYGLKLAFRVSELRSRNVGSLIDIASTFTDLGARFDLHETTRPDIQ